MISRISSQSCNFFSLLSSSLKDVCFLIGFGILLQSILCSAGGDLQKFYDLSAHMMTYKNTYKVFLYCRMII